MQVKTSIKQKFYWLSDDEIKQTYDMALADYMRFRYPSENNRPTIDKLNYDFLITQWLYVRMVDILERAGGISLNSYKENNLNLTYGGSYIDPMLVAQIMPKAGVPR